MTLTEIIEMFRTECPDITENVISDALIKDWCLVGDKEICASTRCIVGEATISSIVTSSVYDTRFNLVSEITKFYDIDDFPGGGVSYDNIPLIKTSIAELDAEDSSWRSRSAGTPEKYYRRGQWLYFDYPIDTADKEIKIYVVLVSDDFTGNTQEPFNGLGYLEPFHYSLVKYLEWKAKAKIGKQQDAQIAKGEFVDYIKFMKAQLGGNKFSPIKIKAPNNLYQNPNIG